jgi:hypothetical protein
MTWYRRLLLALGIVGENIRHRRREWRTRKDLLAVQMRRVCR